MKALIVVGTQEYINVDLQKRNSTICIEVYYLSVIVEVSITVLNVRQWSIYMVGKYKGMISINGELSYCTPIA